MVQQVTLTTPEKMVYMWLTKHHIMFDYQYPVAGGRQELGGSIGDFILTDLMPPLYLRVQGTYWHAKREAIARDMMEREQLVTMGYQVVDVWERRIMESIDRVMNAAMGGQELGE